MTNERGHRMLFIREAEIVTIAPTEKSKFCLKIAAGSKKQKTEEIKIDGAGTMPKWTINMDLGDLDPQTMVSWKLYGRRRLRLKVLGSVEKTLGELFEGSCTSTDIHLSDGTYEIAVLKISGSSSAKTLMDELVPSIRKPSQNYQFLDSSETLETVFNAAKGMIDTLAGVHPAATVAWGFLSIGFKVLKNQRDANQAVLDLYAEMISVYEEASKNDTLQQRDGLHGTYSSLFKQTIECAMFIEGYAKKSGIGRLFTIDISGQAAKFHQAFADLKDQLTRGFARESAIVTLGVQELVNIQIMRDWLRDLQPPHKLGPKSKCMQGTRVATINTMVSWIAQCDGKTMWCKGLAGTGKSSLMGTLHDLLTADIGGRSRLAAFVRYDRIEYPNANKLITSIAYALGTFDVRIGMTISKVMETSRTVMTMLDLSAQFRLLLRGPLERVPDLVDEGPLVVIVDGLDECDASDDLLAVLADGFGPNLPFMRLIISSRPVHHIATAFKERDGICTLHLDTSSKDVDRDIQFYLEKMFATICNDDDVFQEKCKKWDAINQLAARASGLFIWAATVATFVLAFPGRERLESLLATDIPRDATEALTTLYRTALNTLVSELPGANADVKKYVRNVLGAVLVAKTPPGMTEDILDKLVLDEGSPRSHHIVSMLGSVLSPETEDSPIRSIHKSLDDFLQDRSRCGDEWFVDVPLHRRAIARRCLDTSELFLQKWSPKIDMDIAAIPVHISEYALCGAFWYLNAFDKSGLELFASFFRRYFLPWLDVHLSIRSDDVLPNLTMVLNWSNQFGSTESRTLFYHAYLFAYRALQDGEQSHLGLSHISTGMVSLSPSSNIIRKAWERLNVSEPLPISPDKERLLSCMTSGLKFSRTLIPDSDSLTSIMTFKTTPSLMTVQWEIDTGQQKPSSEIPYTSSFDQQNFASTIWGLSIVLFKHELATPPSTSDWIRLPFHDYHVSQGTNDNLLWCYMAVFDSRTRTLKKYTLFCSHFLPREFSITPYDNGFVLVHDVGYFMKIAVGQEHSFTWTSIPRSNYRGRSEFPAYQDLCICRDGSKIVLSHQLPSGDIIKLCDARTGTTVLRVSPLDIEGHIIAVSDDGTKVALHNRHPKMIRVIDMNMDGEVVTVIHDAVEYMPISFLGGSKIAYILHQCLIIQSLVTSNILFRHGIPEYQEEGRYHIQATPDGTRVVTHDPYETCMVWDVGDL
ncbi:hypothetical protein EDD85DRAFT_955231 [Armillaria nabsnona]|nr:hypothetical protein EDD85DRAFT_955231 [Armillaria nabsnona]